MINICHSKRLPGYKYVSYLAKYNKYVKKLLLSHLDLKSRKYLRMIPNNHDEMKNRVIQILQAKPVSFQSVLI